MTSPLLDQPRDDGGRFDSFEHGAPEVRLPHERPEGTFLFPPSSWPGGVEQYIDFWMHAEISDETLSNLASSYAAERDAWEREELEKFAEEWGNGPEGRALAARMNVTPQERAAARGRARSVRLEELEREHPRRMSMGGARATARAAQMYLNTDRLPEGEDIQRVHDMVVITNVAGKEVTVSQVWKTYRLGEIMPDALLGSYGVERKLDDLREEIAEMRLSR